MRVMVGYTCLVMFSILAISCKGSTVPKLRVQHQVNRIVYRVPAQLPQRIRNVPTRQGVPSGGCLSSSSNNERQLQTYISNVEALTGVIQELDEAVQQMKEYVDPKSCDEQSASVGTQSGRDHTGSLNFLGANRLYEEIMGNFSSATPQTGTTESFTDPPLEYVRNRREDSVRPNHFGFPATPVSTAPPQDQAGEDLLNASNDLKTLRKDLNVTAEWLRQTNHTVHSVMLRALQAYVTSIERRVDQQRQVYNQTRGVGLKPKIAAIKEKVGILMARLKSLVPFKQQQHVNRVDDAPVISSNSSRPISSSARASP